jgi:hypothetical protein
MAMRASEEVRFMRRLLPRRAWVSAASFGVEKLTAGKAGVQREELYQT